MENPSYRQMCASAPPRTRRPLIGITGNYDTDRRCTLADGYYKSVMRAGGVPVILPPFQLGGRDELRVAEDMLAPLDGIVFSGGGDINPLLVGEEPVPELHGCNPERDAQELLLARLAADRQIPMLGICKGIQVITAALGGTNWQDIHSHGANATVKHSQDMPREAASHTVELESDSTLAHIYGKTSMQVNSFHHQAVRTPAPGMRVCARATDGIIEAVESAEMKSIVGVQWHPECLTWRRDEAADDVFGWLVGEARAFRQAKDFHRRHLTLDSHCDTPMFFDQHIDFARRDDRLCVDLHKMQEGGLDATIMVAYLPQGARDAASLLAATEKADHILTQIEEMAEANRDSVGLARTPADLYRLKDEGRKAIMLGIENGYAIGKDLANVARFRQRGVVYMTLCHNGDNDLCDSARGAHEHGGVSAFGADVIREMNRVGMLVDLSHGGEESFYDALEISRLPIVCSHSSARALCDHPRNLTDAQLKALARRGGVAQVTLYHGFLRPDPEPASLRDAMDHLNHMVSVMGVEHVGIGTDFDGDGGVAGCRNAAELINFTRQLMAARYSEADMRLIWGENFLRVMRQAQAAAQPDTPRN